MPTATTGRARPRYPGALVDRIVTGIRGGRPLQGQQKPGPGVVDVGCGTGIVARQFQAAGTTITNFNIPAPHRLKIRLLAVCNPAPQVYTGAAKWRIFTIAITGPCKNEQMPELPEVETARRLIADEALHRRITDVDDSDTFVCRPHSPGELRAALTGRTLTAARRRGKSMWCETSQDGPDLGIHLGMGGRILVTSADGRTVEGGGPRRRDAQLKRAEWDRFTLSFADGGSLVLFDKRRLGRVRLNPGIDALGPDAAEVAPAEFRDLITRGSVAVKARLLDQSRIAGVGNLLADEILWQARVHPAARTDTLRPADADRLYHALESALKSAIARGGVHTGDVIAARHPGGGCPRCGAEMRHGTVGGRSTWWCSREQALAEGQAPTTVR
jgi:formamidopyrimidine-DNA glycosylase